MKLNTYGERPPVRMIDADTFRTAERVATGDIGTVDVTINGETRTMKATRSGRTITLDEPVHGKRLRGKKLFEFRLSLCVGHPWEEIEAWHGYPPYNTTYMIVGFGLGADAPKGDAVQRKGSHLRLVV